MISNHAKVLLTVIACALVAAEWTKEMDHFRKANCGLRELHPTRQTCGAQGTINGNCVWLNGQRNAKTTDRRRHRHRQSIV
uniref:Secreted protein n=1 Tax=Caenorhabditis japonica TaxID=281687 RepID=A0A8R1DX07_CAEJA